MFKNNQNSSILFIKTFRIVIQKKSIFTILAKLENTPDLLT
jgi:hypothetical protein